MSNFIDDFILESFCCRLLNQAKNLLQYVIYHLLFFCALLWLTVDKKKRGGKSKKKNKGKREEALRFFRIVQGKEGGALQWQAEDNRL